MPGTPATSLSIAIAAPPLGEPTTMALSVVEQRRRRSVFDAFNSRRQRREHVQTALEVVGLADRADSIPKYVSETFAWLESGDCPISNYMIEALIEKDLDRPTQLLGERALNTFAILWATEFRQRDRAASERAKELPQPAREDPQVDVVVHDPVLQ